MMPTNPFKRKSKTNAAARNDGMIRQAYTVGGEMFTDGEVIPQALRSTMERELRGLQRGSSGVSDSGLATAVKLSVPAMACIGYFSSQAASIPIAVQKDDIIEHHPFEFFLSQSPSLMEDVVRSYLIFGKIFIQKIYNERDIKGHPRGFPTGLKYVNPNNIEQIVDKQTQVITGYRLKLENNRQVPPSDIIYLPDFDPSGDGNPLSKLENAFVHLGVEQGIANFAMSFFLNRAVPVGIVSFEPPISPPEFKKQKQSWKREFTGSKQAFKTAFTNGKVNWTPITDAPKDLAMANLTDNSKQMVAAAFNVPPELVGLSDNSGNSLSVEQRTATQKIFLEGIVIPLVGKILDALNQQWLWVDFGPRGFYNLVTNERTMAIFSAVTQSLIDMTSKMLADGSITYDQQYTMLNLPLPELEEGEVRITAPPGNAIAMWNAGLISLNMARGMVGLEPLASGNIYNVSGANIQVPEADIGGIFAKPSYLPFANPSVTIQQASELASGTDIAAPTAPPPETNPVDELPAEVVAEGVGEVVEQTGTTPPALSTPQRSAITVDIAVDFAGHNFVKMAQRQLAKQLDGQALDWTDSGNWRLQLISYDTLAPEQIPILKQRFDLDSQNIDLVSNGYRVHNNSIYWTIDTSRELSLLRSGLRVRLENMTGELGDSAPLIGIKLCDCGDSVITDDMLGEDIIGAPLVVDSVSVFVNGELTNSWRIQRVTPAQRSELRKWGDKFRTSAKRGIAFSDVHFEFEYMPQHVVDYVREQIKPGCDITEIFKEARSRLAVRAIQSTLIDFEIFMEDIIAEARAGNLTRPRFTTQLRNAINRFGNAAYRDGLVDGGVLDGVLTDEDREIADEMVNENQSFAKNLSARVFSEDGISDEEAASRPAMWGRSVVMPLYNAGRLSADKNGMYELVQASKTVDKCADCKRLLGQVHRFKDWAKRNLLMPNPGRQKTECEGWECGHTQIKVDARARGNF
jgi:HK97 family phage portal protein